MVYAFFFSIYHLGRCLLIIGVCVLPLKKQYTEYGARKSRIQNILLNRAFSLLSTLYSPLYSVLCYLYSPFNLLPDSRYFPAAKPASSFFDIIA